MQIRKFKTSISLALAATLVLTSPTSVLAQNSVSAKGSQGQTLTVTLPNGGLQKDQTTEVVVRGKGFKTGTGIYVTFCVTPQKGKKPEHCGAYNPTGINSQAHWISSNPPFYAKLLAKKFGKAGTFKVTLPINSKIGEFDCTKVSCAILTRADHTNPDRRKADVVIPITFK